MLQFRPSSNIICSASLLFWWRPWGMVQEKQSQVIDFTEFVMLDISRVGRISFANFDASSGPSRCSTAYDNRDLASMSRSHPLWASISISGLELIWCLLKLKALEDFVCAPCPQYDSFLSEACDFSYDVQAGTTNSHGYSWSCKIPVSWREILCSSDC